MTVLIVSILALVIIYLLYKFAKWAIAIYLLFCAGLLISFPLMIYDLNLGVMVFIWSTALLVCSYLLVVVSGFIGGLVALFIVGPIVSIWFAIKLILLKSK